MRIFIVLFFITAIKTGVFSQFNNCDPINASYSYNYENFSIQLLADSNFFSYTWEPGSSLSNPNIYNPIAPLISQTYIVTTTQFGPNLFVNGDFSLGNTNFLTDLNNSSSYAPGNYCVLPSFFLTNYSTGDHTLNNDEIFMSVDGAFVSGVIWEQEINSIASSTDFQFSFWATEGGTINPPNFEIHFIGNVTGDEIVDTLTNYTPTAIWNWINLLTPIWNSGPNTSVIVRIINLETDGYGNDFGLDDLSFYERCISQDTVEINLSLNTSGCTDPSAINYNPLASISDGSCIYHIPTIEVYNVITPDANGQNDLFCVKATNVSEITLKIVNRWGNIIFEETGLNPTWNGTVKGQIAVEGVYFYSYSVTGINNEKIEGHGFLELIK